MFRVQIASSMFRVSLRTNILKEKKMEDHLFLFSTERAKQCEM